MLKQLLILNGPNLNLLGLRQPEVYGKSSFDVFFKELQFRFQDQCELTLVQSNAEHELIEQIHQAAGKYQAIVVNGGGLSHTSVALADAVRSVPLPAISVHISNTHIREEYRRRDLLAEACEGAIIGLGLEGYSLAIEHLLDVFKESDDR